ncbi:hypothetical protein [Sphingobium sp. CCH11-B1]|nr:hypothetical protein [Sphingobium sp. CCH11-B1]
MTATQSLEQGVAQDRDPRLLTLSQMLAVVIAIITIGGALLIACPNPKGF